MNRSSTLKVVFIAVSVLGIVRVGEVHAQNATAAKLVELQQMGTSELMEYLSTLYGHQLRSEPHRFDPQVTDYMLHSPAGNETLHLRVGRKPGEIQLTGPATHVEQAAYLMRVIELQVRDNSARVVRQHPVVRSLSKSGERESGELDGSIQPAQFTEQVGPADQDNPASESVGNPTELDPQLRQRLRDLGSNVQVEVLPDLDVIILRGRDQEIDELAKIIQQIERLAVDAQPRIEIYELKHAQDQAVAELIEEVEDQYTGARQGRVSITALGKPNGLLVIGWGSAVDATLDLIAKLDQPVAPETQFDVHFLKHAAAVDAAATLEEFFGNRESLGTRLTVTSDRRTNAVIVHGAARDLVEAARLLVELDAKFGASRNQARVVKMQHSLAADIAEVMEELLGALRGESGSERAAALELLTLDDEGRRQLLAVPLESVRITPNPYNNTLVLSGPSDSLDALVEMVNLLDTPRDTAQLKVFPIEHGDAANLVQVLQSLLVTGTAQGASQLPNSTGENSLTPLRFSVDDRTNTIIATGPEGDLKIVAALLARLDESDASQRRNAVYHLKNAPATEVALAINQFLTSKRQIENAVASNSNVFQQLEKEVVVVPEPVNNKLILSATPRFFDELNDLIQRLDESPPQVVIQVMIGEVTLSDTEELGVELGLQDSVLFDRGLLGDLVTTTNTTQTSTADGVVTVTEQVIQAATNTPGFNFNNLPLGNSGSTKALANSNTVGTQGLSSFAVGRVNSELGFGGLVLAASSESVSMLIRALQESRRIEILSRPQVRTLDNQPAYVQVGQRVPRIISSSVTQFGQTNAIDYDDVGLILGVTPRISPDGTVVMEIDAEKSSLSTQEGIPISTSADGTVTRAPLVNTTRAQTTVSAANGETIVLAGLITKETNNTHRRVPYLSQIPILGDLFRFDSVIARRTELLIILTPQVIYTQEDSERIKQVEVARMSWCAADVFDVHGDIHYFLSEDQAILNPPAQIIFPDGAPLQEGEGALQSDDTIMPIFDRSSPAAEMNR